MAHRNETGKMSALCHASEVDGIVVNRVFLVAMMAMLNPRQEKGKDMLQLVQQNARQLVAGYTPGIGNRQVMVPELAGRITGMLDRVGNAALTEVVEKEQVRADRLKEMQQRVAAKPIPTTPQPHRPSSSEMPRPSVHSQATYRETVKAVQNQSEEAQQAAKAARTQREALLDATKGMSEQRQALEIAYDPYQRAQVWKQAELLPTTKPVRDRIHQLAGWSNTIDKRMRQIGNILCVGVTPHKYKDPVYCQNISLPTLDPFNFYEELAFLSAYRGTMFRDKKLIEQGRNAARAAANMAFYDALENAYNPDSSKYVKFSELLAIAEMGMGNLLMTGF